MTSSSVTTTQSQASVPAGPAAPSTAGYDAGLLLLRIVLGLTMAAHGSQKLFGWFGGGGISGTGQFFTASGYPAGDAMAVLAGLTETLGGLALAAGLLTPLAAAALVGTLVNAIVVHGTGAFFAPKGIEYELLLTAGAAALALTGPGRYAADRFLPVLRGHRLAHGALAVVLGLALGGALLLVKN